MKKKVFLVLENGLVYEGYAFGAEKSAYGEVVFNTSMTGYQEMLTDPSYAGQIVVLTYPLIGNYGINDEDFESKKVQVAGFVVREECRKPSHWKSKRTLDEFLKSQGISGIADVDTRSLTRQIRSSGVMMGIVTSNETPEKALERLENLPRYNSTDFMKKVTTDSFSIWIPLSKEPFTTSKWGELASKLSAELSSNKYQVSIVIVDFGLKYNIRRILNHLGCLVIVVPCTSSADEILKLNPDGIVLSPGPGDPALLKYLEGTVQKLVGKKPVMGICLGHQFIARAFGARTFKLKFGHRGANHPVHDLETGRVYITAQNHGYAVDPDTLQGGLEVSHLNLNDGTVEGLRHRELPVFSIQYHSEASPGPLDTTYLFEKFLASIN